MPNRNLTRETLFNEKRRTYQRMRLCIEIDVPDADFDRDTFNQASLSLIGQVEQPNSESLWPHGCRVVLVTTEDAK